MNPAHFADLPLLLQDRLPSLTGRLAWLPLGRFPTPVQEVAGLEVPLWIKRDDLARPGNASGLPGGNKVRKLEFILAAALARGARVLIASGGTGSHHLEACARYGAAHGLEVICVAGPQYPTTAAQARFARLQQSGARIVRVPRLTWTPVVAAAWRTATPDAWLVEPGGSGPLGVLGHLVGGLELAAQIRNGVLPCPAELWVAAGSGGTLAGLLLGLRWAGLERIRVVGVQVVPWPWLSRSLVALECAAALHLLARLAGPQVRLPAAPTPGEIELVAAELGPGYGIPTPGALTASARLAEVAGIRLEPTYTAKAMAGLLRAWTGRHPRRASPVLFWQTYGG